jgi:hypothetical protein
MNDRVPGIKERELEKLGTCPICGQVILKGGELTFYRLRIERAIWDPAAIQRRAGLSMMLGNSALAAVMGPDEDLAKVFTGPIEVVVHESCTESAFLLARICEARAEQDEPEAAAE